MTKEEQQIRRRGHSLDEIDRRVARLVAQARENGTARPVSLVRRFDKAIKK